MEQEKIKEILKDANKNMQDLKNYFCKEKSFITLKNYYHFEDLKQNFLHLIDIIEKQTTIK